MFPGSSHQQDPTPISTAPDLPALQAEFQHDLLQGPHLESSTPPSQVWSPILFCAPSAVGVSFKAPSFTYMRIPPFPEAGILPCSHWPHSQASPRQGVTRSNGSLIRYICAAHPSLQPSMYLRLTTALNGTSHGSLRTALGNRF